jgi:tRNA G18 (ribose-2'-O)-methylase SpoU
MTVHRFSQKKFQSFDFKQQHKKCAELLKEVIECEAKARLQLLSHYLELCAWMDFEPLRSFHLEDLADRFHAHMELCGIGVREDGMLKVRTQDLSYPRAEVLPVTLYLQELRSAHNIGSIVRSAECMGLYQVVTSPKTASLDHLQVKRACMGCEQWISIQQHQPLSICPRPWIALETVEGAMACWEFEFPASEFTLVIGNEEYGIRQEILRQCDDIIQIPVFGRKNSLNVASALSCVAYEIRRQYPL